MQIYNKFAYSLQNHCQILKNEEPYREYKTKAVYILFIHLFYFLSLHMRTLTPFSKSSTQD